ncbi:hypothetical protein CFB40_22395 [Burkholderia sp. AU31652]|nr:hypothetical protein CFB40_22395 [Burkholderia sp. AU31652]
MRTQPAQRTRRAAADLLQARGGLPFVIARARRIFRRASRVEPAFRHFAASLLRCRAICAAQ